ncbi:uncharacterized protein B0H64DRAFT_472993 [Chaetomium fimeti]|uniref:J domain-containing protein n=1 Tax=Chaetomium fimeti TaxID=1854472 RepID=A0AAE0HHR8_9PEZI|nr:hypothetical protein B0H64DRAFT_472993 [Chaetomium fimeti]
MPLRFTLTSAALTAQLPAPTAVWSCHRFFHASPRALRLETNAGSSANHYETLNVHPTASPAEIKKSFYHLSKRHHPDHNPSDPHAPTRFMRISEAYAVLSHADKRARYDRHHGHHHHPHQNRPPAAGASYHSTGPAGGRPASGLGRRRGTYQGPPPSFYRSGGWGAHGAKRRAAHEESTGGAGSGFGTDAHPHRYSGAGAGSGAGTGTGPGTGGGSGVGAGPPPPPPPPPPPGGSSGGGGGGGFGFGGTGGMGPGQDPYGHRDDVPHFDHEAHERAQRRGDERRAHRRAARQGVNIDQPESATTVSFLGAAAILAIVVSGPFLISGVRDWMTAGGSGNSSSKGGEKEKAKGNNSKDNLKCKEGGGR